MTLMPACLLLFSGTGQLPVISESMANPPVETTGEYVEIHNPSPSPCPVTGFTITDGDALDGLLAWDEAVHGPFPHPFAVTGTDTIPPLGYALLFVLDYTDGQLLDIPDGTVILTTGDHAICNGLAASSDPLTLFRAGGTSCSDVLSTYGTPVESDYWADRDDDGADGIPFDPGDGCGVERMHMSGPDIEQNWVATGPGGTPGWSPDYPDTCDVCIENLWTEPGQPVPGEACLLFASLLNCGSVEVSGVETTIFLDSNADSLPDPGEIVAWALSGLLLPGWRDTLSTVLTLDDGNYLLAALADHPDDQVPGNDLLMQGLVCGTGSCPCISEVLCNPSDQDRDEFIELYFAGSGVFDLSGCHFTDGDALDQIVEWDVADPLEDPDARYGCYMPSGSWALILDSEYTGGVQPWDLSPSTLVLTTANTTLGDGLTSNDPVTLYGRSGTEEVDIVSTYGTPVSSDDPLQCDDDGLDGIPYDPGKDNSVHRLDLSGPDIEGNWGDSPEGPTPGAPPPPIQEGADAEAALLSLSPPMGAVQTVVSILATVVSSGSEAIPAQALTVVLWADLDGDATPDPPELILTHQVVQELPPGDSLEIEAQWESLAGTVEIFVMTQCVADSCPLNDTLSTVWNIQPGTVINEIMYYPAPGQPEWIEIRNGVPWQIDLQEWIFRDAGSNTAISDTVALLQPGELAVVCPDTTGFLVIWGDIGCLLCQPSSWPVLNNTTQPGEEYADLLSIESPGGQVMDFVPYDDDWGGGQNQSLERLGNDLPGYSQSSWSGSPPGGTPGAENSGASGSAGGSFLSFHPDPFSPDGDGVDDVLVIEMSSSAPQNSVTVTLYDVSGRTVRRLLRDELSGSTCTSIWDGCSDSGEPLPVGRYIVYIRAVSPDGEPREDCAVVVLARRL